MMSFARMPRVVFAVGVAALLGSLAVPARAVTIDMVPVGNAGNANDTTGYGGVNYPYQIGRYDVTIGQYTNFLNAVATTDTYSLYNASMATNLNVAGILQTGSTGSYTYSAVGPAGTTPAGASSPGNRPITYVDWFDSARFANWMANGQPTGAQSSTTTENGAYNVNGATSGNAPAKNVTNPNTSAAPTFFIPNENEWYKAAYFDPTLNSGSGGYYTYATQSNTAPGNIVGSGTNQANYNNGVYSVTQSGVLDPNQNYLTDVGAFSGSGSFYGTFDQSGNVYQWNDLDGTSDFFRGLRGGYWYDGASFLSSSGRHANVPSSESNFIVGFRLASPVAVPEPSTWVMGLAGIACGGWEMWRRRRAR
jgi:formylglycine-generating enzyme required for sulfatase activity